MKPLPKKINKAKLVELYSNQMSTKKVLEEIQGFQEQCGFNNRGRLIHDKVKKLFFERFGLPTGYELIE